MDSIITSEYFREASKIPSKLYVSGNLMHNSNKRLAIVGSRRPSLYGRMVTEKIISQIKKLPITIVSGLALGIDSHAHECALKYGVHTIAVPGSGLDKSVLYPKTNCGLADRIISNGGALLSIWDNQAASNWTFPSRNSVMAAISDFVLIIEAQEDSGTMITAKEAIKRNIKLGAIPGNIDNIFSTGPNKLIKDGAILVTCLDDILGHINLTKENFNTSGAVLNHPVLKYISEPIHRDALSLMTGINVSELGVELTMLEINGAIIIDGSGYVRLT